MTDTRIDAVQDRARVWQLLALAFAHPIAELHEQMADGRFQGALDQAIRGAYGTTLALPRTTLDLRLFESQYIRLFDIGPKGRPLVPLCAGGYDSLLGGEGRPQLMLQYARFYGHFGLRTLDGDAEHELPDHLTCQLECLAWLSHLEGRSLNQGESAQGYRQARHDFIDRLLGPQCRLMVPQLSTVCAARGFDPFFAALGAALDQVQARDLEQLRSTLDAVAANPPPPSVASGQAQNLWG
jgi:DMSO reductase family type II enzyme chaperone